MDDRDPTGYDYICSGSAQGAPARHTDLSYRSAGNFDLNITPEETAAILLEQARAFSRAVERFRAEMERVVSRRT